MLISKEVEIVASGKNISHLLKLGYDLPKTKNKYGKEVIDKNTKIVVPLDHLLESSAVFVEVQCDGCCKIMNMRWVDYKIQVHNDKKYYCKICTAKIFSSKKIQKTFLSKSNHSFEDWCIQNNNQEILDRWDYYLNKCKPSEVCYCSDKKYWFKCPLGVHKSELKHIKSFVRGHIKTMECSYCNSVGYLFPESLGVWSENNEKTPYDYSAYSSTTVYWKCLKGKHKDYRRKIGASNTYCFRCPECVKESRESILQEKVRTYIESLGYTILHEDRCTIVPINPKSKHIMPFDNEIMELKLLIEVHGRQHYQETTGNWVTDLATRKLYDRYKRLYAHTKGYLYLEIPYWEDNQCNSWKLLIDNIIDKPEKKKISIEKI